MFRWIIKSSLRYRFIVLAAAAALMFVGADQMRRMPVDVFPEFAPPIVEIQTPCLGLSPTEVEALVTIPIEQALAGLPNVDILRSKSVTDLSSVKLIFKRAADPMLARQHVQEGLTQVIEVIPKDVGPPVMLQPLSATARFLKIGVSSKTLSVVQQSMLAYWTIRPRLLAVPGVANVAIWGERIDMKQIQVEPPKLRENGITVQDVMDATSDALEAGLMTHSEGAWIGTGGFIETPNQRLGIRHRLPIVDPATLGEVTMENKHGKPVRLKDVAQVVDGHQPLIGDAVINGGPGLLLIVEKFPWANTLHVTKGVDEALAALRPGLPDLEMDEHIFRPAGFVEISIKHLSRSLLLGCLFVMVVLALFLYEWRVALITCAAIPLSLMAGMMVLYFRGTTINTMILAGFVIALGSLVDDAIVGIENVVRRLRQHRKEKSGQSTARVILESSLEVRHAIVHATLIEVLALLPVFFLGGLSGAFFTPLAISYSLSLLASMVVALTVTPALALMLLANAPLDRESPFVHWLKAVYERVLRAIVPRPAASYAVVALFALAGAVVAPRLGQSLLPDFKERDFLMHWLTEPGTSLAEEVRITAASDGELRNIPGVRNFGAHIGQALIMDEVYGVYFGENWISVDPKVDYDKTLAAVQAAVDGYPGLVRDVQTYLKERIREVLTGSPTAITVRVYGDNLSTIREKADEIKASFESIPGMVDLKVESLKEIVQLDVKVDLDQAVEYGVKPGDVRRTAAALVTGTEAGDIFRDGKAYDVNVWSTPEYRHSVHSIRNLMIDTPLHGQVPLHQLASVELVPTPNAVERWQMKRKIDVRANVRKGWDLGSVVADAREKLATISFPEGYHQEMLGEYQEREAAGRRMRLLIVITMVGIFLILQAAFNDWRLAVVGFITLPAALVGGILAAWLGDGIMSLGSIVGFLTVLGVVARNGIMMICHYQHLEREEGVPFGLELVIRGAMERISPILMTASATGLALVPLLVAGTIPGHEIEHPMALVILGGLITSTTLNLMVMPALYLKFGRPQPRAEARHTA